jgi:hypothetical protein
MGHIVARGWNKAKRNYALGLIFKIPSPLEGEGKGEGYFAIGISPLIPTFSLQGRR